MGEVIQFPRDRWQRCYELSHDASCDCIDCYIEYDDNIYDVLYQEWKLKFKNDDPAA